VAETVADRLPPTPARVRLLLAACARYAACPRAHDAGRASVSTLTCAPNNILTLLPLCATYSSMTPERVTIRMTLLNPCLPFTGKCCEGVEMTPRGRRGLWDCWTARCGPPFPRQRQTCGWRRCSSRNVWARRPRRPSPGAHARHTLPPRRSPRSWRSSRERRRALQAHLIGYPVAKTQVHCLIALLTCLVSQTRSVHKHIGCRPALAS